MAAKKNPNDAPADFDDLLDLTNDEETSPVSENEDDVEDLLGEATEGVAETPDQKRIRELEAMLAKPAPVYEAEEEPENLDQLRIKELEDALARRKSAELELAPPQYDEPAKGDGILIHVLIDGFIALGEVWYRGQEMEFQVGGRSYEQTKDRTGKSWVDLASDVNAQYARWGKQYLGVGPFIGRPDEKFDDAVAVADRRRGRAVPLLHG